MVPAFADPCSFVLLTICGQFLLYMDYSIKMSAASEDKGLTSNTISGFKMGFKAPIPVYYGNINMYCLCKDATCIITECILYLSETQTKSYKICLYTYKYFFRPQDSIHGHLNVAFEFNNIFCVPL